MSSFCKIIVALLIILLFYGCKTADMKADGYGNFEAEEITVSAENSGKILYSALNEGGNLDSGQTVLITDTVALALKIPQLVLQKRIIAGKKEIITTQAAVIEEQIKSANREKERSEKLLPSGAVPAKQFDDVNSQVDVLTRQLTSIQTQGTTINDEIAAVESQIVQIRDQIRRCYVKNPVTGTVLVKYMNSGETVQSGKPLYKIADLSTMTLKIYVSGARAANLKIGQQVRIKTDADSLAASLTGKITYIADKAEFTPKIIQTREERVNQVYAIKIAVPNNGTLKIGMPGEAVFE